LDHDSNDCPLDGLEREIHDVANRIEREAKINGVEDPARLVPGE
jgi:hypothetical protein